MIPFFVRRYNDIDHVTPIVWRMAQEGRAIPVVLCLDPLFDLDADYRIAFLRDRGVTVEHLAAYRRSSLRGAVLGAGLGLARAAGVDLVTRNLGRAIWTEEEAARWAAALIDSERPPLLVFDWQKPKMPVVKALFAAAGSAGVPLVGVPHGGHHTIGKWFTRKAVESGEPPSFGRNWSNFDHLTVQDRYFAELVVDCGADASKVDVIGSARFCAEWVEQLHALLEDAPCPVTPEGMLKVLYLDHSAEYRIRAGVLAEGLARVSELDFVHLIVKGSTGGAFKTAAKRGSGLSSDRLRELTEVADDMQTVPLVRWADVVLGTTTSALMEATVQDKTLIMPQHFHENRTLYEQYGACWPVSSDHELVEALSSLYRDPARRPYGQDAVRNFLTDMVYGGEPGKDVLGAYVEYLLAIAGDRK